MKPTERPDPDQRISFSFYAVDVEALTKLGVDVRRAGTGVPRTTVMRALIHLTPEAELLAHAILYHQRYATQPGWGTERIAQVASIILPKSYVDKLDNVVDEMALKKMTVSRSDVMRARIVTPPPIATFAPAVAKFVAANPDRRKNS